ncbi:hypothetical protein GCM10008090_02620 [Arenicella chitinivorans]|uniref:Uncharacterized protein n=1 Tax=Arenicella chitinivorans TaxID=1329800 RepID=A0A918VHT3_9GAMM|nr:hypothetical protein [Arenicella chitinivorans]GGZ97770.1 hypothetical protein GCM10008090_02620 [Arenicella chitinivorans]
MNIFKTVLSYKPRLHHDRSRGFVFSALLVGSLFSSINVASVEPSELQTAWSGAWTDGEGGDISVRVDGQFLTVSGRDVYSVYQTTCLLSADRKQANCQGDGVQMRSGNRFLYRSEWTLTPAGINEKWVADLAREQLQGELTFTRDSEVSR